MLSTLQVEHNLFLFIGNDPIGDYSTCVQALIRDTEFLAQTVYFGSC